MRLSLLADKPEDIRTIARWYHDKWAAKDGVSIDELVTRLRPFVKTETVPLMVVAHDSSELVGAAQLKIREMSIYPEFIHWLGGVYVKESHRRKGIGGSLVTAVKQKARELGITTLYLQTERLDGGLYTRHEFIKLHETGYRGRYVTVMQCSLDKPGTTASR